MGEVRQRHAAAVGFIALLAIVSITGPPPARARASGYSPYVDMTLRDDPRLPAVQRDTGAKSLSLAFVIATRSRCVPSWGGTTPLRSRPVRREVAAVRAAGADVIVSFGGAAGPDLSRVCATSQRLAAAYRSAVEVYAAHQVDFDIEGAALDDPAASRRAILAIGALERWARSRHRRLRVSLTVPVDPTGLEPDVVRLLAIARERGVRVDIVNVMTMDFGDGLAPPAQGTMGGYATAAAVATEQQLARMLPGGGFSRLGVTVMIGINAQPDEVFTVPDANALVAFASAHGLARLAIWSVARDRACAQPASAARDDCSGVAQAPDAFSRLFGAY